jgi:hypothetical protein
MKRWQVDGGSPMPSSGKQPDAERLERAARAFREKHQPFDNAPMGRESRWEDRFAAAFADSEVRRALEAERGECAKIAESAPFGDFNIREQIAAAIRSRMEGL